MSDAPEYTKRGVAFGRMYFAVLGIVFLGIGVMAFVTQEPPINWILGGIGVVSGIAGLIYSSSQPGRNVAHSAKTLIEDFDE